MARLFEANSNSKTEATILMNSPKLDNKRSEMLLGLMSLDFCFNIQMVG